MNLKRILISLSLLALTPHQVLSSGGKGEMPDLKDEDSFRVSSHLPLKNETSSSGTSSTSSSSSSSHSSIENPDQQHLKKAIPMCLSNLEKKWGALQKQIEPLKALAQSSDPDPLFSSDAKNHLKTIIPSLKSPKDLLSSLNTALSAESFSWNDDFLNPLIPPQAEINTLLMTLSPSSEGNSYIESLKEIKKFYDSSYAELQRAKSRRLLTCGGGHPRGGGYSRSGGGEVKQ